MAEKNPILEAAFASQDTLKTAAAMLAKTQATGEQPDPEEAKKLAQQVKDHMHYTASLNLLQNLTKAYSAKFSQGQAQQ